MWQKHLLGVKDQSPAEKRASATAMNLFFGALIGANLGNLQMMSLRDYTLLAALVCLIVLYLQVAPVARRRWEHVGRLAALIVLLYVLLIDPFGHDVFEGRPVPAPHLFVTICLWLVSVAAIELRPIASDPVPPPPPDMR